MTTRTTTGQALDVLLLLDDPSGFAGVEGNETFLFVSEAVEAIEASLLRLGHQPRRVSWQMGIVETISALAARPPDVAFVLGQPVPTDPDDEMRVTGLLELLGIAHTSESMSALELCTDKVRAKALFDLHAIPTPAYAVSERGELPENLPAPPWIAKPAREDGSVGIDWDARVLDRATLAARLPESYRHFRQPILIESFVGATEFQVGLIGEELLPLVEIDFSQLPGDRAPVAGYPAKWKYDSVEFKAVAYHCPARISASLGARIHELARRTARAFQLQRCSRLDIRMDDQQRLYVIDVNPNPDLSPVATMHKMAQVAGFGFDGLVERLLGLARAGRYPREAWAKAAKETQPCRS